MNRFQIVPARVRAAFLITILSTTLVGCGEDKNSGVAFPQLNEVCSADAAISGVIAARGFREITPEDFVARLQAKRESIWTQSEAYISETSTVKYPTDDTVYNSDESTFVISTSTGPNTEPLVEMKCGAASDSNPVDPASKSFSTIARVGDGMRLSTKEEFDGWESAISYDQVGKLLSVTHQKSPPAGNNGMDNAEWAVFEDATKLRASLDEVRAIKVSEGVTYSAEMSIYGSPNGQLAMLLKVRSFGSHESATFSGVSTTFMVMEAK